MSDVQGTVEARFYIRESSEHGAQGPEGQHTGRIAMSAVSRGDQNKSWTHATPVANLEMTVNNPSAFELLRRWQREGVDVRVILQPVIVAKPDDGHEFRQSDEGTGAATSVYSSPGICGECGQRHPDVA